MKASKPILLVVSLIFSAIIVYGTALAARGFNEDFLLENGLNDMGYLLLTLGIALPFILYILIAKRNITKVISISGLFLIIIFVPVYFSSVSENPQMNLEESKYYIITFFVTSILFVATSHFAIYSNKK